MRDPFTKECQHCHCFYTKKNHHSMVRWLESKYCGSACALAAQKNPREIGHCEYCGGEISQIVSAKEYKRKFCTYYCKRQADRERRERARQAELAEIAAMRKTCPACKGEFAPRPEDRKSDFLKRVCCCMVCARNWHTQQLIDGTAQTRIGREIEKEIRTIADIACDKGRESELFGTRRFEDHPWAGKREGYWRKENSDWAAHGREI